MGASLFRERAPESNSSAIGSWKAEGRNQHERCWDQLSAVLPGRSMVVFMSDFLEAEDTLPDRLRFSLSAHYESSYAGLGPDEIDLPDAEAMRFREMEGEREISTSPKVISEDYRKDMLGFQEKLQENLAMVSAEFETFFTNQDLGHALRRYLGMRNRLS